MDTKTLEQLYQELGDERTKNAQIFETIIEIKHHDSHLLSIKQSLYCDIKGWCYNYIVSKQEKDYGYDSYEHSRIKEKITDSSLNDRQRLALVHYVKYILSQYNDDGAWLNEEMTKSKLAILKKENWLKYLILLSSSNKKRCVITILLFYIVELVILLPAPLECMQVFDFQQTNYSTVSWLNYMANVLALKIDWIEGPRLGCLNWIGVVMCGIWLLVYIVFIVNILFNNIFADISEYDEQQ